MVTIKDVKTIVTQPAGSRLVIVKITTSENGLYGLGCATFTQRFHAVHAAIEKHLKPFLIGRDVDRIEEIWQMSMVNGYWRNGPVLNNAISGVDQALWDIKGKRAGMPVYQLLGGKCREAADTYAHAMGATSARWSIACATTWNRAIGTSACRWAGTAGSRRPSKNQMARPTGRIITRGEYCRRMCEMIEYVRAEIGPEIELLHDIHERLRQ